MVRQYVRLAAVRTPDVASDTYTAAQIQNAEADSLTTQDYIQYILSQIRLIQGTESWKEPPAVSLTGVAATMDQLQQTMAQVTQLSTQITQLSQKEQADEASFVTQPQIAQLSAQLSDATTQLTEQTQGIAHTLATLQASQANQAAQSASMVTLQGLQNAIAAATLYDQPLSGQYNHLNRVFTAPNVFVLSTLRVFLNGQRLLPGASSDYVAAQSAQGLGYNQIVLTSFQAPPSLRDALTADYIPA